MTQRSVIATMNGKKKEFPNITECAKFIKYARSTVRIAIIKKRELGGWLIEYAEPNNAEPRVKKPNKGTISVSEFIKENDIFILVSAAAKKIEKGDMYDESTFVQQFLPRKSNYRKALEHPDNRKNRGKSGGRWYWGHPADIDDLKKRGLLND